MSTYLIVQSPSEPENIWDYEVASVEAAVSIALGFLQSLHSQGVMNKDMPLVYVESEEVVKANICQGVHPLWHSVEKEDGRIAPDHSKKPMRPSELGLKAMRPDPKIGERLTEEAPVWIYQCVGVED